MEKRSENSIKSPQWPQSLPGGGQKWLVGIIFLAIMSIGFLVRVEHLREWKKRPDLSFYKGEPLLTNYDGYHYLRLARDFAEGRTNPKKGISRIPLLSLTAGMVSRVGHFSINWVGALLPAFLGILLAIPLYGLGKIYGGRLMGLASMPLALLAPHYVQRSSLGWFDTDCMYVTLPLAIAFCSLMFALNRGWSRYLYLVIVLILYYLLVWWWGKRGFALVVTGVPLLLAFSLYYRPSKREGLIFFSVVIGLGAAFLLWKGTGPIAKELNWAYHGFYRKVSFYVTKQGPGFFPNQLISISEAEVPSLRQVVAYTTNNAFVLGLSVVGLAVLFCRRAKDTLFLWPLLLCGLAGFFIARKLLIFFAPLVGLGMGHVVWWLWNLKQRHKVMGYAAIIVAVMAAVPALYKDLKKTYWPKDPAMVVGAMAELSKNTPKNALIWAWWDHGYPIQYWARRSVVAHGGRHGPELIVYNAIPLATKNPRLAANFMTFFGTRGMRGVRIFYAAVRNDYPKGFRLMKEILALGPEKGLEVIRSARLRPIGRWKTPQDWLHLFYPNRPRPVFLFFDYTLMKSAYWWYFFGTWDPGKKTGRHPSLWVMLDPVLRKGDHLVSPGVFDLDMKKGIARTRRGDYPFSRVFINDGAKLSVLDLRFKGYVFDFLEKVKIGVASSPDISDTLFVNMFHRSFANRKYFSPILLESPFCQIWEVKGDRIPRTG